LVAWLLFGGCFDQRDVPARASDIRITLAESRRSM